MLLVLLNWRAPLGQMTQVDGRLVVVVAFNGIYGGEEIENRLMS